MTFDEGADRTTLVADDFDLEIPATFSTRRGHAYTLRFGDADWLARIAELTEPGEVRVADDPDVQAAFFDGLVGGTEVLADP